ncbi:hypothetical protein Hte_007188 [Hypoxylon texense]
MRPVTAANVSLARDKLLYLKTRGLRKDLRYVKRLLAHDSASIRSKGGIALPSELWAMILKFARAELRVRFYLVKLDLESTEASAPPSSPGDAVVVRCVRHRFDWPAYWVIAGSLEHDRAVYDFEHYLANATPSTADELDTEIPELRRCAGPGNTFDVVLGNDAESAGASYLFTFDDVPDFIAEVEEGRCGVCGSGRFICPGCIGGSALKFSVFMSCGVDLACPLCMGVPFSQNHMGYLQNCLHGHPDDGDTEVMRELLEGRLEKLGYDDEVPRGALRATFLGR